MNALVGLGLWRAGRRLAQRAYDAAPGKLDLECVVLIPLGRPEGEIGCRLETFCRRGAPGEQFLSFQVTPRLVRDAAERQPRAIDPVAVYCEPDGDGDECKGVG